MTRIPTGGGVPGGSNTQVQFNDSGTFGGDSAWTWDKTTNVMTLIVSSDNPPIQIITEGSNLVDVGAIKLWSAVNNSTEKLLSAGDGVVFDENVAIYAMGYIDVVPEGSVAYDAHVLKKNTTGFNAGRAGTAETSGSVTGLFSSAQSVSDGRVFGFWANMGTQDGGGMLIQGTGGNGTSELGKHFVIWGNTALNANKALSVGNGTTFTEKVYILNNGLIASIAGISDKMATHGGKIKDFITSIGNIGTGEDDLYAYTTEAGILNNNGDEIDGSFGLKIVTSGGTATRQIKLWFGGTAIFDTGALLYSGASNVVISYSIIRVSSTTVRYRITLTTQGATLAAYTAVGELTGLTLSNTNVLKLTGEAAGVGASTDDIIAHNGDVFWWPASI